MPPEVNCPICAGKIPDWHFEWHSHEDQKSIYAKQTAMQCPICKANVGFDGFVLTVAEPGLTVARRDILKAARWAWNFTENKTLLDYLQTNEGLPFKDYWTDAEVQAADLNVAANSE